MKRRTKVIYRRARDMGKRFAVGLKGDVAAAGGGAAAALIEQHLLTPKDGETNFITDNWWGKGAVFGILGLLVRRYIKIGGYGTSLGYGLLGVAGYRLLADYSADEPQESAGVWGRRAWAVHDAGAVINATQRAFGPAQAAGFNDTFDPAYQWEQANRAA